MEKKKLYTLESLLYCNSRIVRARVIEILSVLFEWDSNPLETLGKPTNDEVDRLDQCYDNMFNLAISMIENANQVDTLTTGVSIMDCSFILLKRRPSYTSADTCFVMLLGLTDICLDKSTAGDVQCIKNASNLLNKSSRSNPMKKSLLQLLLRVIDALCQIYPNIIKVSFFLCINYHFIAKHKKYIEHENG